MNTDESPDDHSPGDSDSAPASAGHRKLRLDQFLKWVRAVGTGGEAKVRIQWGEVTVNGEVETRRGRGLHPGDIVEFAGQTYEVDESLWTEDPAANPDPE